MVLFDLTKQPNLSNGISAAEKRTSEGHRASHRCAAVYRHAVCRFSFPRGHSRIPGGRGAYLRGAHTQMEALELSTIAQGHLWSFSPFRVGNGGLREHFVIFT